MDSVKNLLVKSTRSPNVLRVVVEVLEYINHGRGTAAQMKYPWKKQLSFHAGFLFVTCHLALSFGQPHYHRPSLPWYRKHACRWSGVSISHCCHHRPHSPLLGKESVIPGKDLERVTWPLQNGHVISEYAVLSLSSCHIHCTLLLVWHETAERPPQSLLYNLVGHRDGKQGTERVRLWQGKKQGGRGQEEQKQSCYVPCTLARDTSLLRRHLGKALKAIRAIWLSIWLEWEEAGTVSQAVSTLPICAGQILH